MKRKKDYSPFELLYFSLHLNVIGKCEVIYDESLSVIFQIDKSQRVDMGAGMGRLKTRI